MRRLVRAVLIGGVVAVAVAVATAVPARAQMAGGGVAGAYGMGVSPSGYGALGYPYYAAPGYYGVGVGYPSYGMVQTYSVFSSPYGAGYGYGYPPYGVLPGRYGVNLWRPGFTSPGYSYGAGFYRTFPVVTYPPSMSYPPVGVYASGLGPGY